MCTTSVPERAIGATMEKWGRKKVAEGHGTAHVGRLPCESAA